MSSRSATPGATEQTVNVDVFNTSWDKVVLTPSSPGLTLAWIGWMNGRPSDPNPLTPAARSVVGEWGPAGAITNILDESSNTTQEHAVDLPDAAFSGQYEQVSVSIVATGVRAAISETIQVVNSGGQNAVAVTVRDTLGNLLDGASISLVANLVTLQTQRTTDGLATLWAQDGTYTIVTSLTGFDVDQTVVVLSGAGQSVDVTLTQFTPTTSATGMVTGYLTCYDQAGDPESGVEHTLRVVVLPANATGLSINTSTRTVTSGTGMNNVQFADLVPGGVYSIQRSTGVQVQFEVPECFNVPPSFPIQISGGPT